MGRKQNGFITLGILGSLLLLTAIACAPSKKEKRFVIGFSQCLGGTWRDIMLDEMKRELSFHTNVTLLYKQADANTLKQKEQVKELLTHDIDLLIVSPNEAEPLTPVITEAFNNGVPVIVVDRKIASAAYTAYVGGDNYEVGRMAGEYAVHLLKGKGNIIEITLPPGSSPASERHKGFADALAKYPNLHLVHQINGEWLKQNEEDSVTRIIRQHVDADLVFAQNDFLASKTADLYKRNGLPKPLLIGVDGLPGNGEGMQLVSDRAITATMLYPTGGEEAIQIALKIINKQPFKKENLLQTTVIDSTNVRIMQLQAAKAASQQRQNERQQTMLSEQKKIYNSQRTFVYILTSSLALALALGGLAFYSLSENRKINRKLQLKNIQISESLHENNKINEMLQAKNREITDQKAQLEVMSARAQAATEAKVAFFTNISHEFRTPLTLILAPLEELMAVCKNQHVAVHNLTLIQKNVMRLLRLVNELMDFRKIEVDKMKIYASQHNLILFISQILQSYKTISQKRNIDLRLITTERQLNVWMDASLLDKVIFNLLSNAFKFTKDEGFIHVYVSKTENEAVIKVEDNGVGMSKDMLEHAFEVYYQGDYENRKGSGLGLALSKELIRLHKGAISVSSEKGKGTSFEICLPLGYVHLEKDERAEDVSSLAASYDHERVYLSDLQTTGVIQNNNAEAQKEHSVLIIEDNEDLRNFLSFKLSAQYDIYEAGDGQTALQQAFDAIPDLIICDVVIPGKDGIALTSIFKNDVRTSHIPVILLTAKTSINQQIEGMRNKADIYITKPFNTEFLMQTINSLLLNRVRLKEHLISEVSVGLRTQTIGKLDKNFLSTFTALVEGNLSNTDFGVEEICKTMGVSKGLLYKKVKALLNSNVNDYILNVRMQKAKYLLQHEECTIGEIAYKVGFSAPTYFTTVFKTKFGITPKAFKER